MHIAEAQVQGEITGLPTKNLKIAAVLTDPEVHEIMTLNVRSATFKSAKAFDIHGPVLTILCSKPVERQDPISL